MNGEGDFSTDFSILPLCGIAAIIGSACAFIAAALLALIAFFTNLFFFHHFSLSPVSPATNTLGLWVIITPVIGGLIIGLMARYGSDKIRGHGIPEALEAILFRKSIMEPKVAVLKPLSAAISIGSGGPFGAEGPIIMTGGAAGSLFAQLFRLSASERKTLLVAGAAAGMSAVFATPIAATLLAVELLLFEWKPRSLVPVAVASVAAYVFRPFLLGNGPIFPMAVHVQIGVIEILTCCGVGVVAGVFSSGTSRLLYRLEDFFKELPIHWMWWPALGGIAVGLGGYFQPRALGVGYDVIADLLNGHIAPASALGLLAVKSLIWVVALASGTSGGVLAPLLIMGCGLGVVETVILPQSMHMIYPLISMAAVMGGIMRSPFTSVIFAFELTRNTDALVPTFVATIISYVVTVLLMKRSILTEKVSRRGYHVFMEYAVDPLESVRVAEVMTRDVVQLPPDQTLTTVINEYFGSSRKHRGYPVVAQGKMMGIVTASDILKALADGGSADRTIGEICKKTVVSIGPRQTCRQAVEAMVSGEVGRLPVVSPSHPQTIVGIVSRTDVLKPFSKAQFLETVRERVLFSDYQAEEEEGDPEEIE